MVTCDKRKTDYLLYIKMSGVQMMFGGNLRSFTFPYSDSFHLTQSVRQDKGNVIFLFSCKH